MPASIFAPPTVTPPVAPPDARPNRGPVPAAGMAGPDSRGLTLGRHLARLAVSADDVEQALALRQICFRGGADGRSDRDGLDARCLHGLVEVAQTAAPVCTFRLLPLASGRDANLSYAAQFYDLTALCLHPGPLLELGRFCVRPGHGDPDVLRAAWALITREVDARKVALLFGCSSFAGADPALHHEALAYLGAHHQAPALWRPRQKSPEVAPLPVEPRATATRAALAGMPPLLRSYLGMGGWVSDHAVIDRDLDTLHVFTGVEIALVPPARARALRALSAAAAAPGPGTQG